MVSLCIQTTVVNREQAFEQLVTQLNRQLIGWANYFCLGPVWKAA
jgi:hypothetical protein